MTGEGGDSGDGEHSGCFFKTEITVFAGGLDERHEKKRGAMGDSGSLRWNSWKKGISIY